MKYSSTDVTKRASITKKTLRHYQKIGILNPIIEENGYWYYTDEDLTTLQLIQTLQVMGFTLKEIKTSIDSNYKHLRDQVLEKKNYIKEQTMQLDLASRLIEKIEKKESLSPYDAIMESFEEEHLEWYKQQLPKQQYDLVINMLNNPESVDDHQQLLIGLNSYKNQLNTGRPIGTIIKTIKSIFTKYNIDNATINIVLESFITANLEGPLSQRILSIQESTKFLEHLEQYEA
jgi:DNA-binding transcriptional MerR regulator